MESLKLRLFCNLKKLFFFTDVLLFYNKLHQLITKLYCMESLKLRLFCNLKKLFFFYRCVAILQ